MANYKPDSSYQSKFISLIFKNKSSSVHLNTRFPHIVDKHLDLTPFDEWYNNDKGGAV